MTSYVDLLPVAFEAVNLASSLLRTRAPGVLTVKGDRDMASEADFVIEQTVRAALRESTPDVSFLGEEEGRSGTTSELLWALDPIDGTVNFIRGIPLCGVSLGLIHGDRSVLGVIDLPFLGMRYSAVEHRGAYANGRPVQTSRTSKLRDAVVAIGDYAVGQQAAHKNILRLAVTQKLAASAQRVRMHGSAAVDLAWLADGKVDAVIMLSNKPWDTAAGVVIAREAGATIVDLDGSPHAVDSAATIGASNALIGEILGLIRDAKANPLPPRAESP